MEYDIEAAIPHRAPFLFLDEIIEASPGRVVAFSTPRPDHPLWEKVYSGHYPAMPITPGVLLCEMLFQASAVMVHEMVRTADAADAGVLSGVPVVTRIGQVKIRNIVWPGQKLVLDVALSERLANAFFMKGAVKTAGPDGSPVGGKTVLQAEFAVALANPASPE